MKIKKIIKFLFLFFVFINLSGCSENQQIHQKLVVQGIGIDFEENKYIVTVQALDFKNPVDENEPNVRIIQTSGPALLGALDNISKQTSLIPIYSQNMVIILGKNVAEIGIDNFIDFFIRHCETRPKVKICVTQNKAFEILNIKSPEGKTLKAKDICDLIPDELNSDILHFVSDLKNGISSSYIAWVEANNQAGGKGVCLQGVATFSDNVLDSFLSDKDAYGFMILKGVPNFGSSTISMEGFGDVTCLINKISNNTKVSIKDGNPYFDINLNIDVSVFAMDKKYEFYFDEETKNLIAEKFSKEIENICKDVINLCISKGEDVFRWGRILKNSNPNYFKEIERGWNENIKKCSYILNQNINIAATGKEPI